MRDIEAGGCCPGWFFVERQILLERVPSVFPHPIQPKQNNTRLDSRSSEAQSSNASHIV